MVGIEAGGQGSILHQKFHPTKVGGEFNIASQEIKKHFLPEAIESLKEKGIDAFYNLTGFPVRNLASNHIIKNKFWSIDSLKYDIPAPSIQIAINPHQPFIPESNKKNFQGQEELIKSYPSYLGVKGVEGFMPEAQHTVDVLIQHWFATGEHLLGEEHGNIFTSTNTPTNPPKDPPEENNLRATVGCFSKYLGLRIGSRHSKEIDTNVYALAIFIPA